MAVKLANPTLKVFHLAEKLANLSVWEAGMDFRLEHYLYLEFQTAETLANLTRMGFGMALYLVHYLKKDSLRAET